MSTQESTEYRLQEVCSLTGLGRSTLFKYLSVFGELLEDSVYTKDGMKYITQQGLELIKQIINMKEQGHQTLKGIKEKLMNSDIIGCHAVHTDVYDTIDPLFDRLKRENERLLEQNQKLKDERDYFKEQFEQTQQLLKDITSELSEERQRHDVIVMQLTRQFEQQTKLLEYIREQQNKRKWWKLWRR
ncbi:TPA: hypothetical protein EYP66_15760 [Candidatus Poribacteria bacterium]|nr:hypothetical protein [Candidatus Poribacteria bacterium]